MGHTLTRTSSLMLGSVRVGRSYASRANAFLLVSLLVGCAQLKKNESSSDMNSERESAVEAQAGFPPPDPYLPPSDGDPTEAVAGTKEISAPPETKGDVGSKTQPKQKMHSGAMASPLRAKSRKLLTVSYPKKAKITISLHSEFATELNAEGDSLQGASMESGSTLPNSNDKPIEPASSEMQKFEALKAVTEERAQETDGGDETEPTLKTKGISESVGEKQESKAETLPSQGLQNLQGSISGLTKPGLVLTDAIGNLVRPQPEATEFQFKEGQAYLTNEDSHQLIIVRQPVGQRCTVLKRSTIQSSYAISCGAPEYSVNHSEEKVMRDCFQIASRGAAFTLGYREDSKWKPFADVSLEPIGVDRQQHKTYVQGRVVLESIIHLPLVAPVANIEWLNFDPGLEGGGASQRSSKAGGMPLDLKVGESRSYTVTSSIQLPELAQAKVTAVEQVVKLLAIGELRTEAGIFPLVCQMEEFARGEPAGVQSWYAPGYGIVKTTIHLPGNKLRTLEAIEIQQRPE
jgi:hypothetical protein